MRHSGVSRNVTTTFAANHNVDEWKRRLSAGVNSETGPFKRHVLGDTKCIKMLWVSMQHMAVNRVVCSQATQHSILFSMALCTGSKSLAATMHGNGACS